MDPSTLDQLKKLVMYPTTKYVQHRLMGGELRFTVSKRDGNNCTLAFRDTCERMIEVPGGVELVEVGTSRIIKPIENTVFLLEHEENYMLNWHGKFVTAFTNSDGMFHNIMCGTEGTLKMYKMVTAI